MFKLASKALHIKRVKKNLKQRNIIFKRILNKCIIKSSFQGIKYSAIIYIYKIMNFRVHITFQRTNAKDIITVKCICNKNLVLNTFKNVI